MYFIFVLYFMYHIHVECCTKISYFCILAFVLYFHLYTCWKKEKVYFMYFISKKAKIFSSISSWHIFIIYMGLRHFCLHVGTRDSWILRHSFWSIDQASTCPIVGARCYQLFSTIVELPLELPVIDHDECLSPEFRSSVCSRVSQFLAELSIFCKIHVLTPLGRL